MNCCGNENKCCDEPTLVKGEEVTVENGIVREKTNLEKEIDRQTGEIRLLDETLNLLIYGMKSFCKHPDTVYGREGDESCESSASMWRLRENRKLIQDIKGKLEHFIDNLDIL